MGDSPFFYEHALYAVIFVIDIVGILQSQKFSKITKILVVSILLAYTTASIAIPSYYVREYLWKPEDTNYTFGRIEYVSNRKNAIKIGYLDTEGKYWSFEEFIGVELCEKYNYKVGDSINVGYWKHNPFYRKVRR